MYSKQFRKAFFAVLRTSVDLLRVYTLRNSADDTAQ